MPEPRIALVTYKPQAELIIDVDLPALQRTIGAAGAEAAPVYWDEPQVDWATFDLAVIRSTWDYTWRTEEFLAWADRCGSLTKLVNPPSVVRWNADKRYLGVLAERRVPVVHTRYLSPHDTLDLPLDYEYVIKPTMGAGARYAARYRPEERNEALQHVKHMHTEGLTAIVQPYMPRIDVTGERSLVFVGGRFLHAIQKNAVLSPATSYDQQKVAHPGLRPWRPTDAEQAVAKLALTATPGSQDLLYARVDLVDDESGKPLVMELELIEPNLFLAMHPDSLLSVADTITQTAAAARQLRL